MSTTVQKASFISTNGNFPENKLYLPENIMEWAARICYHSIFKFGTAPDFMHKIIESKHMDILEHGFYGFVTKWNNDYDLNTVYYFYYILSQKYPFLRIDIYPADRKIGLYGNIRVWHEMYANNFADLWGVLNSDNIQEMILSLHSMYPSVFSVPLWLKSQNDLLGKQIRNNYANEREKLISKSGIITKTGANIVLLGKCESNFTKRWHATVQISGVSRSFTHQLVRHRLLSFCLSGETYVNAFGGDKKWKLSELYDWSNDAIRKGRLKLITLRGMDNNKKIIPVKIKSVIKSGDKDVYEVITQSGRKIKSTLQHLYNTPNGWKQLENLNIGDLVWTNGIEAYKDADFIREHYLVQNKERKTLAREINCSDATLGKWIARHKLQKPKNQYPNRHGGHGRKLTNEEKEKISVPMTGDKNHRWKGDDIGNGGGRTRANRMYLAELCSICDSTVRVQRHHIDKDPTNNATNNIEILCELCHKSRHNNRTKISLSDKIISINYIGVETTYDLEIDHECHNFVANGFVVHNSQSSQRYIDASDFKYVLPLSISGNNIELAKSMMSNLNDTYKLLRKTNLKEDARFILPNAAMTQIIVSGEEIGWNHFLKLRCAKDAQEEIREVAFAIRNILGENND